jgi:hypothetical protein
LSGGCGVAKRIDVVVIASHVNGAVDNGEGVNPSAGLGVEGIDVVVIAAYVADVSERL